VPQADGVEKDDGFAALEFPQQSQPLGAPIHKLNPRPPTLPSGLELGQDLLPSSVVRHERVADG